MTAMIERLSDALADRYDVERELGAGGMATVYLARDPRHARDVALKVLRPEVAESLGRERFLREIRLVAQLNHPHILPLFDSGEAGGFLFFVMPVMQGQTLRDRMHQEGALAWESAVRIATEVADMLYYTKDGSVYAIAAAGGEPTRIACGDSITVDPASGELIVKSDEPDRFVLTRVAPDGSDPRPIRISGSFRLVPRPVLAGAVRDGRLLLPITSSDSWYWSLGTLDLRTGAMEKLRVDQLFDVHGATWTRDGGVLAVTLGIQGPLMRFRRVGSRDN